MAVLYYGALAVAAAVYGGLPLLTYKNQRLLARFKQQPDIEPDLQKSLCPLYDLWDLGLKDIGFEPAICSFMVNGAVMGYFTVYTKPNETCFAMICSVQHSHTQAVVNYVEFGESFGDGWVLDINTSPIISGYPKSAQKLMLRFPELEDVNVLWRHFVSLRVALASHRGRVKWEPADLRGLMEKEFARESDELAARGYCKEEIDEKGTRGLTLWGAYYMTWKQLPPILWWFKWRDAAVKKRMLQLAEHIDA